jgi:hypothetical protein
MKRRLHVDDRVRLKRGPIAVVEKVLRVGYRVKFEPGHSIVGHSHFRITRIDVEEVLPPRMDEP